MFSPAAIAAEIAAPDGIELLDEQRQLDMRRQLARRIFAANKPRQDRSSPPTQNVKKKNRRRFLSNYSFICRQGSVAQ